MMETVGRASLFKCLRICNSLVHYPLYLTTNNNFFYCSLILGEWQKKDNIIEQDHRYTKLRVIASQNFRNFWSAKRTISGYESMNIIRKGQVKNVERGDVLGQIRFIHSLFGIAVWSWENDHLNQHQFFFYLFFLQHYLPIGCTPLMERGEVRYWLIIVMATLKASA